MFTKLTGVKREMQEVREQLEGDVANLTFVNGLLVSLRAKMLEAVRTGQDKVLVLRWKGQNLNPAELSTNKRLLYEACIYEGFDITLEPEMKHRGCIESVSMYVLLKER